MKTKRIEVQTIVNYLNNKVVCVDGLIEDAFIDNLADADHVNETSLDWINPSKQDKQSFAEKSKAKVLLVDETINPIKGKILIHVANPKIALAEIGNYFFVDQWDPNIHPTAIIDERAQIGLNCYIGPYTVIGKANIGDGCYIDSHVHIYDDVILGNDCVIKSGAMLGGAGFGYEKDEQGNRFRFPQIGQLIIGNFVEIGSNTCIDRGALSDTIIGDFTKINNLCHIAHNNKIGKNVIITGCVNVSGSNVIDDNVWIAPNSSIRGWVHIGHDATIGMGAVVVKDVPANETWIGNPAKKMERR